MPPWLSSVLSILAVVLSVITWAAKLKWSKEFADAKRAQIESLESQLKQLAVAKDETIKAKDAQIESLRLHLQNLNELSPVKLRDHVAATTEILAGRVTLLKEELESKTSQLSAAETKIVALQNQPIERSEPSAASEPITRLQIERGNLESQITKLRTQIENLELAQDELKDQSLLPTVWNIREINLVDKSGKVRARFTTLLDDTPRLLFFDEQGDDPEALALISLGPDTDGGGGLLLYDKNRRFQIELGISGDEADLQIARVGGPSYIQLIMKNDGQPIFYLSNSAGDTTAVLELQNNRPPRFELYTENRKIWSWQDSR